MSQINNSTDPRIEKTKNTLRETLCKLLIKKPLDQISIKELSSQANINRSTFYLHYSNVNELYLELKETLLNEYQQTLQKFSVRFTSSHYAKTDTTSYAVEHDLLKETFLFIKDHKMYAPIILAKGYGDQILNELVGLGEKIFMKDLHLRKNQISKGEELFYFTYIANGIIALIQTWVKSGMKEKPEQMAEMIIRFIY